MIPMLSLYILEIFEGDIVMDNDLRNAVLGKKRSAVFAAEVGQKKHWPNGRVPFLIDSSLSMFFFQLWYIDVFKRFERWHHNSVSSHFNGHVIFINRLSKEFTFKPYWLPMM